MADFTLRVRNFRALGTFEWSPQGVNLLAGANGTGKTTVMNALLFLRLLFQRGHEAAFTQVGARYFRSMTVPDTEFVVFELEVGAVLWRLRFPMTNRGLKDSFGEEVLHEKTAIVHAEPFKETWHLGTTAEQRPLDETRCGAKVAWERGNAGKMKPLVDLLTSVQVFTRYHLHQVKHPKPEEPYKQALSWNGANLWSVLATWKSAPRRSEGRFEWVMAEVKKAFPGLLEDLEFEGDDPVLFPKGFGAEQGLPPERAADGMLTGLLHLTALAGMRQGGVLAFDEIENQLHPHAIRSLLRSLRERAEEKDLSIIITTHSPVVMNEFREDLDHVFVLAPLCAGAPVPTRLTELHHEDWLAQSKLGTLYEDLAFASPFDTPTP